MGVFLGMILIFIVGFVVGGSVYYRDAKEEIQKAESLENLKIRYGVDK